MNLRSFSFVFIILLPFTMKGKGIILPASSDSTHSLKKNFDFRKGIYTTGAFNYIVSKDRKDLGAHWDLGYGFCNFFYIGSGFSIDAMDFSLLQTYLTSHIHIKPEAPLVPFVFVNLGYNIKVIFEDKNYHNPKGGLGYTAGIGIKKIIKNQYVISYFCGIKTIKISYSYDTTSEKDLKAIKELVRIFFGLGFQF